MISEATACASLVLPIKQKTEAVNLSYDDVNKLQWLPILVKMWQWLQTNLKNNATFSNRCTQALLSAFRLNQVKPSLKYEDIG